MEEYEIKEAYRLLYEREKKLASIINIVEKDFVKKVGNHDLQVRVIVKPENYGGILFKIEREFYDFIVSINSRIVRYNEITLFYPDQRNPRENIGPDYYFFKCHIPMLTTILIKTDGVIIFNLQFDVPKNDVERDRFKYDSYDTGKCGLTNDRSIKIELIAHCILTFCDFIHEFYQKVNYWTGLSLVFKIEGIKAWKFAENEYSDDAFKPVIFYEEVANISKEKVKILETFFTPLMNGYRQSSQYRDSFLARIKSYHNPKDL